MRNTGVRARSIPGAARLTVGAILTVLLLAGCGIDRLNHLHDEDNKKLSEEAQKEFDAFRSEDDGLLSRRLGNLKTKKEFERAVEQERRAFLDLATLHEVGAMNWFDLRGQLYSELGVDRWFAGNAIRDRIALIHKILDAGQRREEARAAGRPADAAAASDDIERFTVLAVMVANATRLEAAGQTVDPNLRNALEQKATFEDAVYDLRPDFATRLREIVRPFDTAAVLEALDAPENDEVRSRILETAAPLLAVGATPSVLVDLILLDLDQEARPALDARLRLRLTKLAAVLKTYEVLVKAERARIAKLKAAQKKAAEQIEKLSTTEKPTPPPPSEEEAATARALDIVLDVRRAIASYYADEKTRDKLREQAGAQQKKLLLLAEQSRDPVSVYSLVPMVGAGLDDESFELLDDYLAHLARAFSLAKDKGGIPAAKGAGVAADPEREKREPGNALLESLSDLDRLVGLVSDKKIGDAIAAPDDADSLDRILKGIKKTSALLELDLDIEKARKHLEAIGNLAGPLQVILAGKAPGDDAIESTVRLLVGSFGFDTARADEALESVLTEKRVEYVRGLLSDIGAESRDATRRILVFSDKIRGLQRRVHEENVRHFLSLNSIVRREVVRWTTLRGLNEDLDILFDDGRFPKAASARAMAPVLFRDVAAGQDPDAVGTHPGISPDELVLRSVRLLAETAQHYQTASPRGASGYDDTRLSADRLRRAMQILHLYQLMTAFNRREAMENRLLLTAEVEEHSIRLDQIVVASTEEEISLGLSEVVAFHRTGVTPADLEVLLGVVRGCLLNRILTEVD